MVSKLLKLYKAPYVLANLTYFKSRQVVKFARHLPGIVRQLRREPGYIRPWLRDRLFWKSPIEQGVPWLSYPCVEFLGENVRPGSRVFEWGSGGSTVFFASRGCEVTTIETSGYWFDRLQRELEARAGDCWGLIEIRRLLADEHGLPLDVDEYAGEVERGAPWDVVVVDGWEREKCAELSRCHLRKGGMLIYDNADLPKYAQIPDMMQGFRRVRFPGLGPARPWPTQTDVYIRG